MKRIAPFLLYFGAFLTSIILATAPISCGTTSSTPAGSGSSGSSSSVDCSNPANAGKLQCAPTDFIDCAKVDLGQIVDTNNVVTLLGQVASIILGGGANWQADLEQLAVTLGKTIGVQAANDALACAVKAVDTVLGIQKITSGSGGPATAAGPPNRAAEFIAKKGYKFKTGAAK